MADHRPSSRARAPRRVRLGERDLEVLWFLAEHRMALPDHVAALLDVAETTAKARLTRLVSAGYVRSAPVFRMRPTMHLITDEGLRVLGSALPQPDIEIRSYQHDAGLAWLWIAARRGTFGPLREVVGERRMRSYDATRGPDAEPFAVKPGGVGPRGGEKLHYPDLLLTTADGRRVALELELSSKGPARLDRIMAGYAADPRIDGVVYLVERSTVARSVHAAARRAGISSLVRIQRVRSTVSNPGEVAARAVTRSAPGRSGPARSAGSRSGSAPAAGSRSRPGPSEAAR